MRTSLAREHQSFPGNDFPFFQHETPAPSTFGGIIPFLYRISKLFIGITLLFSSSAVSYAVFYQSVMPSRHATEKVYFEYPKGRPGDSGGISTHDRQEEQCQENHEYVASASLDLFARHTPWEALVEDVIPTPITIDRLLHSHQSYYIEVLLSLPESPINKAAGIFSIETILASQNRTKLAVSKRSTRLPYESEWIAKVRKTLCLLPLVIGAIEESRIVVVPAFRHYVESLAYPLQYVEIKIVPHVRDGTTANVEVTAGEVRIGKEMNKYQEMLKEWFYTCFVFGTLSFAGLYLLLFEVARSYWIQRFELEEPLCDLELDEELDIQFEGIPQDPVEQPDVVPDDNHAAFPEEDVRTGGPPSRGHVASNVPFSDEDADDLRRSGSSAWEDIVDEDGY